MKVLLFGEYSGLFNCLRDGLVKNGHDVIMASDGNGYKNFPRDIDWYANPRFGKFKHVIEIKKLFDNRQLLRGYDVVLLIHPSIFSRYRLVIKPIFDYLINNNEKVFLSGAGMTSVVLQYWYKSDEKYKKYVLGNIKDVPSLKNGLSPHAIDWEYELLERINGYIPIWYEYAMPFKNHPKCLPTIRIPINLDQHEYKPNRVIDKVVFFHGLTTRANAKGSAIISEAFNKMRKTYGNVAEFVCAGGLPFDEYMSLVSRINVVLDDVNSYSIAMNGLFSLAKGKIVMGGAEPVANNELGLGWNPVYNLCPDVDQVCSCIEDVINKHDMIEEMGRKGREFVEQYHECGNIAKQYVELFNKY